MCSGSHNAQSTSFLFAGLCSIRFVHNRARFCLLVVVPREFKDLVDDVRHLIRFLACELCATCALQGHLMKQSRYFSRWKPRFFRLEDGFLTYYDKKSLVGTHKNKVSCHIILRLHRVFIRIEVAVSFGGEVQK